MLHEVITAEKVLLVFKVAGLGSRFLAWLLDFCLIVFLILVVASRGQRRLGDLAAATLVVFVESQTTPLQALQQGIVVHSARTQLMRQRLEQLSRKQKETILDVCLRRDQLRVRERARLFAAITEYCRQRLDLAPQEHQSDEKFVLQLAASLSADLHGPGLAAAVHRVSA